jgi:cobalt-zinc-cadmium efflux system protein
MANYTHKHNDEHNHDEIKKSPKNIYAIPFLLILGFGFIEAFGGIWINSLALLSDAWHMFSDAFALGLAWFAAHLAAKSGTHTHANGQSHGEIAAAAFNALLMLVIVAYIIYEAIERFKQPQTISGGYVMLIAFAGLLVNLIVAKMLHGGAGASHKHDHNKRAAYLHVLGDLLGSVAALLAGAIIYFTGWLKADPILSIFISLLLLFVTIKLTIDIWHSYKNG